MIKLTDRDYKVIAFIKEYKIAKTSTIKRLFFSTKANACEKRLAKLVEHKKLYRYRENILSEYCYYIKRPSNIKHSLLISDIYSRLITEYKVIKCKREYEIKYRNKSIRADLMAVVQLNNKLVPILFEIDLTKAYDNKYTEYISKYYYKQLFPIEPTIVVISNRTPKNAEISIKWYKLSDIY
jgi:hypothetical protein